MKHENNDILQKKWCEEHNIVLRTVSHWTHYCRGKEARSTLQTTKIQQKKLKVRDVYHNIKCQSVYFKLKARNGEKEQINCNMAFEGVPSSYLPIWKYKHHLTSNLENYGEIFKSKVPPKQTELSMSGHTHHKCMMIASVIKTLICFCVS